MGTWFDIVCHTCRTRYTPSLQKQREILLNDSVAAEVGRFVTIHAGHVCELCGDEYTYSERPRHELGYEPEDIDQNEDVQTAKRLAATTEGR